jgi:hypothetical protein
MPSTFTGLLLFIVLLLPGFAYLVGKERHTTGQRLSAFRETAAVVAASVSFELIVLVLFAIVRTVWPSGTPDVGALIRDSGGYLRGSGHQAGHYGQVAIWGAGLLAVAVTLAYVSTIPTLREETRNFVKNGENLPRARKFASEFIGEYPHESTMSAWWTLFDAWDNGRQIYVECVLEDGSYVRGKLASFSREADDLPERDLILTEPISYRSPGRGATRPHEASTVCISAAKIVTMFVTYVDVT